MGVWSCNWRVGSFFLEVGAPSELLKKWFLAEVASVYIHSPIFHGSGYHFHDHFRECKFVIG